MTIYFSPKTGARSLKIELENCHSGDFRARTVFPTFTKQASNRKTQWKNRTDPRYLKLQTSSDFVAATISFPCSDSDDNSPFLSSAGLEENCRSLENLEEESNSQRKEYLVIEGHARFEVLDKPFTLQFLAPRQLRKINLDSSVYSFVAKLPLIFCTVRNSYFA